MFNVKRKRDYVIYLKAIWLPDIEKLSANRFHIYMTRSRRSDATLECQQKLREIRTKIFRYKSSQRIGQRQVYTLLTYCQERGTKFYTLF